VAGQQQPLAHPEAAVVRGQGVGRAVQIFWPHGAGSPGATADAALGPAAILLDRRGAVFGAALAILRETLAEAFGVALAILRDTLAEALAGVLAILRDTLAEALPASLTARCESPTGPGRAA
jgi:hypothetical protein